MFADCQSEHSSKVFRSESRSCVPAAVTPRISNSEGSLSGEGEEENHSYVHAESGFNSPFTTGLVELPLGCISDTGRLFAGKVRAFPLGKKKKKKENRSEYSGDTHEC